MRSFATRKLKPQAIQLESLSLLSMIRWVELADFSDHFNKNAGFKAITRQMLAFFFEILRIFGLIDGDFGLPKAT
jgi:hypothetical protein